MKKKEMIGRGINSKHIERVEKGREINKRRIDEMNGKKPLIKKKYI